MCYHNSIYITVHIRTYVYNNITDSSSKKKKNIKTVCFKNFTIIAKFVEEMETTALNDIADKFESVLNGLLKKNYNVTNDVYFDMFITHLSDKSNEGKDM